MARPPVDEVMIRPATADDATAVAQMWQRLVTHHQALDDDMPAATEDGAERYANSLAARVDDSHTCIYIAETLEGEIIGYVLGVVVDLMPEMFEQEPSGFLADIYVEEAYRKFGVGRALVDALRGWFSDKGLRYFEWHVSARNEDALNFWKALGGRETMIRMRADVPQKKDENDDNRTPVSDG